MFFKELSNKEWSLIKPLLLPKNKIGKPRFNDRIIINGIIYVIITGYKWENAFNILFL